MRVSDNDPPQTKLQLGTKKYAFMGQLERDSRFLASLNIMDYSLMVGIHHTYR